jgi:uncharacterized RDD family membrane protein YckC
MGTISIWHWLVVLAIVGVPVCAIYLTWRGSKLAPPISDQLGNELAGPWSRYFARMIDINLWNLVLAFIAGTTFFVIIGDLPNLSGNMLIDNFICMLFVTPIALAIDAGFMARFGTTFGKKIFNIRVETESGERLTFTQVLKRNFGVWTFGLALGFPLLTTVAAFLNYRRATHGKRCIWDEGHRYLVRQGDCRGARFAAGAVLFAIIFLGSLAMG